MKRYKIDKKKVKLSDEQVNGHKDFPKLVGNYERMTKPLYKKPLYKDPKALIALLLILTLVYLISIMDDEEQQRQDEATPPDTTIVD